MATAEQITGIGKQYAKPGKIEVFGAWEIKHLTDQELYALKEKLRFWYDRSLDEIRSREIPMQNPDA